MANAEGIRALSRRYEWGSASGCSCGLSIDTVGIILMIGGLLGLLLSALIWSSVSPWSRRRTVAGGDRVVEERRIEREF
jgi:hypothetical protein